MAQANHESTTSRRMFLSAAAALTAAGAVIVPMAKAVDASSDDQFDVDEFAKTSFEPVPEFRTIKGKRATQEAADALRQSLIFACATLGFSKAELIAKARNMQKDGDLQVAESLFGNFDESASLARSAAEILESASARWMCALANI